MGCAAQEGEGESGRGSWADQIEPENERGFGYFSFCKYTFRVQNSNLFHSKSILKLF